MQWASYNNVFYFEQYNWKKYIREQINKIKYIALDDIENW